MTFVLLLYYMFVVFLFAEDGRKLCAQLVDH